MESHEGTFPPVALLVNRSGYDLFSGPVFAHDQNGGTGSCYLTDNAVDFLHFWTGARNSRNGFTLRNRIVIPGLLFNAPEVEYASQRKLQLVHLERFRNVVISSL